ncbi:MAG: DNA primase [Clostridiaceae bacterium]|nr:DNA primase [Clostridiaceae bacterium]
MAGFIPQEIIEQIIEQTDIVQVVEQYLKLSKKSGLNYFGLCPFHHETNPSFSVTPNKQMFYCYSCQRGGNVINFIQEIENFSFPEAVRFLANMQGIEIPTSRDTSKSAASREKRAIQQNILLESARFFYRNLESKAGLKAKNYMKERGFSEKILIRFGIGYANNEWDSLANHLTTKGFSDQDLLDSGIIRQSSRNNLIDLFRDRIMIPIFPSHGKYIIAFGGRSINEEQDPKYINSPETKLYHKGSHLFALNLVRQLRPIPNTIILTEGYMDAMALHQAGFYNTVATLGTALTMNQAKLLDRYAKTIIIAFDSDSAGIKATLKAIEIFKTFKLEIKVLDFGDAEDPDNYIKKNGQSRFKALLKEAPTELDFRINLAKKEAIDQRGELDINQYAASVCQILTELKSAVKTELYAKRLAAEIHVSDKTILQDIEKYRMENNNNSDKLVQFSNNHMVNKQAEKGGEAQYKDNYKYELLFLVLLASFPDIFPKLKNQYKNDFFLHPSLRKIAKKTTVELETGQVSTQKLLQWSKEIDAENTDMQVAPDLMRIIFTIEDKTIQVTEKMYWDTLKKLEINYAKNKEQEILLKLEDKTISKETKSKLIEELAKISNLFK